MATLRTQGLTKSFGGRTVVRDVALDVSSGEVVGLLGPNGAGKTTTFGMVVGLVGPGRGPRAARRRGCHRAIRCTSARGRASAICRRKPSIFRGLTVEQNILAILETLPIDRATRARRGCASCWPSSI